MTGVKFIQPTFIGTGTLLSKGNVTDIPTSPPLSFYAEFNTTGAMGAFGASLVGTYRMPPGFGGWEYYQLVILPDGRIMANVAGPFSFDTPSLHDGPWVAGTTHRAVGVFGSTTSRLVYFDGTAGVEDTQSNQASVIEDVLIGAASTVTEGDFTMGYDGCIRAICIWEAALTEEQSEGLTNGSLSPTDIQTSAIRLWVPCVSEATKLDAYAWDGAALTQITDLIATEYEPPGFDDCEDDETPVPEETGAADECGSEDEADPLSEAITWPKCILVPQRISVDVISPTVSPGRSFTGHEKIVQPDAGRLHVTLYDIPIRTRAHALQWRDLETFLKGRTGAILVPLYEGKLSDTAIIATVSGDHPIGLSEIEFQQDDGEPVVAGMHFSIGERAYRVKRIITQETSGATRASFVPPLREVVEGGADMDFNTPHLRCVLASDDAMNANLEILKFATPTVEFHEDV